MTGALAPFRDSLKRFLSLPLDEGPLLILTHDNPDPDCLASAAAMQFLLRQRRKLSPTVAYSGIIGRAENRAMVELLDLRPRHVTEIDLADYRYLALIDAQPHTGNTVIPTDRPVEIVIDHHPLREATKSAAFYDIRVGLGATATILTEYLRLARIAIPRDLATALLYGIRSETQDLGRETSDEDLKAYEYLVPLADAAKLAAISRPTLERRYYTQLAVALDSLSYAGRSALCSIDEVSDPDFVPEIADLAVRMEGIQWMLAMGGFESRLYLSIRTNDRSGGAGTMMQKILEGLGRGGGHGMRAGGYVDLDGSVQARHEIEAEIARRFLVETGDAGEAVIPVKDSR